MARKRVTSYGPKPVVIMEMDLDEWRYASCVAHFGVGPDWATLYDIESASPGHGHATKLLRQAKLYYETQGKTVGGSVALNDRMASLYVKVGIPEYKEGEVDGDFNLLDRHYKVTREGAMLRREGECS